MYSQTEEHPQEKNSDNATLILAGLHLNHQRHSQGRSALIYAASLADHPDTFLPFCHKEKEINDIHKKYDTSGYIRELKQKLTYKLFLNKWLAHCFAWPFELGMEF